MSIEVQIKELVHKSAMAAEAAGRSISTDDIEALLSEATRNIRPYSKYNNKDKQRYLEERASQDECLEVLLREVPYGPDLLQLGYKGNLLEIYGK